MTIQEMSTEFDVLYNNITSNQAPGLNEYEKSVFLTKAQSQLVNEYFNSRTDGFGGGYDGSQKRQYDFSGLIRTEKLYNVNTFKSRVDQDERLDKRSQVFLFPTNYYLAVNEIISDGKWQYSVIPIDYAEYGRLMMKPYSFPVKRSAWRLLTDKKNCNYVHEDKDGNDLGNVPAPADYSILSTWADQRRTLRINIQTIPWNSSYARETITIDQSTDTLYFKSGDGSYYGYISADCGWNNTIYEVELTVSSSQDTDDEAIIEALKEGFMQLKDYWGTAWSSQDSELRKAADHTDGFQQSEAPSKLFTFSQSGGRTFETKLIAVPFAEIIGKFSGEVDYHLRYVRTLNPIILEDLSIYETDLTIGGISKVSESTLPPETHHEIVERAVTLAKIAWQGGTMTQAAANSRKD